MVKYREIIRLRAMGVSTNNTAISCGCAHSTVERIEKLAREKGLVWPLPEAMNDAAIRSVLFPKRDQNATKHPIDHERVEAELSRRAVTLTLCWNEYCKEAAASGVEPYQYTMFCAHHRKWQRQRQTTMHVGAKCAEKIEVDWAGDAMEFVDPDTGELLKAHVFVACLPYSQYIFARAYPDMGEESWITAHVAMFSHFGGATPLLVPDNCKTGVIKNTLDELIINEQYRRMAEHYGCAVVPARPRRPRDKGSVEMSVGLIERQAMAPLRDRVFLSLEELNAALSDKVDVINARPFQKRDGSRMSEFLGQEKGLLIPLPAAPYKMVVHKRATVQFSYHVAFDGMYYSAPYAYLRREVDVEATRDTVAILCDGVRIATHRRLYGRAGRYATNPEHMPQAHRDFAEWNGDRFRRWGAQMGPATEAVVDGMLTSRTIEQQAYRSCRALLELGRRHGDEVLERACAAALEYSRRPSYKTVKRIVANLSKEMPKDPDEGAYLRGGDYYEKEDAR